jgi:predicted nucleic acid-binding protein
VVDEEHSAKAAILLGFDACHAPDHWRAEAVNVLWSKVLRGDLTAADAEERMTVLLRARWRSTTRFMSRSPRDAIPPW